MTQAYKEYRKAQMECYPYAVSRFYDGKWRYSSRTDSPEKYVDWYKNSYGEEPKNTRITDSRTRKVVWQS